MLIKYEWIGNHCFLPGIGEPKTGDIIELNEDQANAYSSQIKAVKERKKPTTEEDK